MSYREENDQVILTMSREDYETLLLQLGIAAGWVASKDGASGESMLRNLAFLNRLNEGNPNYTPYQVEEEKS